MTDLTQDVLRDVLHYSPETGLFTWRQARGRCSAGESAGYDADRGYRAIRVFGQIIYAHRAAFLYMTGSIPEEVDHINGHRADNRWSNLRASNRAHNSKNMKAPSTNRSGVVGVFWNTGKRKWTARIKVNQKSIHLGHFESIADAARARCVAEMEYGFCANHGRGVSARTDFEPRGVILELQGEAV